MAFGSHLYDDQHERASRSLLLAGAVSLLFLILLARLFYIQVVQAELNMRLSAENRMQLRVLNAPRGRILDRNGEVLARNRPSYSLCVLPYQLRKREQVVANLLRVKTPDGRPLFDSTELVDQLQRARYRRFDLTRLKEDVSLEVVSIIEEHAMDLPGISVETEARREYVLGPVAFHALGYMSEIPEAEFDSLKPAGYNFGDQMGKAGVEKEYESLFRGHNGQEFVEVNAYGKRMGAIENMPRVPPEAGNDLTLTLDARLQRIAAAAFPDTLRGAVVALDPRNGDVLVMVSHPTVDPNIFSLAAGLRSKSWQVAALDSTMPLNNRATVGTYQPGSTFKLVSAVAGLASGKLAPETHMPRPCRGVYHFGSMSKACWLSKGHGSLDLTTAVQASCDIYFYQVGLLLGDTLINHYARLLGMGGPTGVDLPAEKAGWMSGEQLFNERHGGKRGWVWTDGLLLDHAIGQTQTFTPLQLALMVGGLGNGAYLYRPHLLRELHDQNGDLVRSFVPEVMDTLPFSAATVRAMHEAMRRVLGPGGTGGAARVQGVDIGGKSGSAEWKKGEKTHALFIACAPLDSPTIAIAVVAENAGHGGSVAAPIAGKVLAAYFHKDSLSVAAAAARSRVPPAEED
jgi:penicillin-binding protein 2